MNKNRKDYFDYKHDESLRRSFAADYLRQYYDAGRAVTEDEAAVASFIARVASRFTSAKSCIEIGCGPTLHHAIMLAPYVPTLDLADYLEENLVFIESWLERAPHSWCWNSYTKFCLSQEGQNTSQELILEREELTRSRIKNLRTINLLSEQPLGQDSTKYDLVAAFYCTEEIALTTERWRKVIASASSLINPGGYLLISCLEDTDFYHIQSADGAVRSLPCARIKQEDLESILGDLGFDLEQSVIELVRTPGQIEEGVSGVILALARLKE